LKIGTRSAVVTVEKVAQCDSSATGTPQKLVYEDNNKIALLL